MQLRPYQQQLKNDVYNAWQQRDTKNILAVLPTGGGKCLGKGTPVLMFDGTIKKVEDITPGDLLMGPDSTSRKVLSTCRGFEPLYEVRPVKGDSYIVNESHILSLRRTNTTNSPKYPCEFRAGGIVNIEVREYLTKAEYWRHIHKGWRTAINFPTKNLSPDLPPYLLGLWLGDGSARNTGITTKDPEIIQFLTEFAELKGLRVRAEKAQGKCSVYHIVSKGTANGRGGNTLNKALYNLKLKRNKHIPINYLTGDRQQRLELLAGLMDSDGSYDGKGYDFINKNKTLIESTVYLARSLGFSAYVSEVMKSCNMLPKQKYFRCMISGEVNQIPCRIPRKRAKPRLQKKNVLNTGITLSPKGVGEYFGFEIDGDRLFVLGDFTVTHNTVIFSDVIREETAPSCAIAHRQELVTQMSLALARDGVRHRIIGPPSVVKIAVKQHLKELGRSYFVPNAVCAVAGVDTLIRREKELASWSKSVGLWVCDEAHHLLAGNKWGKATAMFPNARGLGVTATPIRADGCGLGRHADGVFDELVEGPPMRWLIDNGYLTDYRIFCPPSDIDLTDVTLSASGDYSPKKLKKAVQRSHITGDIVSHYLKLTSGKRGITFVPDVETAIEQAKRFNDAGVPAAAVSAKTPEAERIRVLQQFRDGKILQLVNCDLFGEGFDVPAVEVVSMGRPTASYGLYAQQFGRALRLMEGKDRAIIIDHVGNVLRHGLPDAAHVWSLDSRERRGPREAPEIPMRFCPACTSPFERIYHTCPFCGHRPVPAARSGPEFVDGDLTELNADALARLRGEIARVDRDVTEYVAELVGRGAPGIAQKAHAKRHLLKQAAQGDLRENIALWAGYQRAAGRPDSESYRRFYFKFGIDVLSAQALGTKEAQALNARIKRDL